MSEQNVEEKVKAIIAERLRADMDKITPEANFINDLGADSLDQVELVMALEDEFGLEIADDEAQKLDTVGKAIEYVKSKVS
ncbi:MAG: acyl carrier protein [Candidatus Omnitrophota bacterium]|nr:acyl carrier protein [Candidatus Omnitrophota bacterium]MBU2529359.1 acyl carrier protein [bacterium]MBU3930317.1 acyl carrier protein [bacterium]MBU4122063.1 acyl carrier protein [bacterium]MDO9514300.1 acyl carrier protein [Elusimicrobiota bacterium]